jgi:hypothetical protein
MIVKKNKMKKKKINQKQRIKRNKYKKKLKKRSTPLLIRIKMK